MAQYVPGVIKSFEAGEDLSSYQYCLVKATGTGSGNDNKVSHATANANTVGVLMNKPEKGEEAEVIITGTAKLKVSEEVGNGQLLTSGSTAQGEVVDAAGEFISAMALEYAGASGDIIEVLVCHGKAHAAE